jgi:hypothetical protein
MREIVGMETPISLASAGVEYLPVRINRNTV